MTKNDFDMQQYRKYLDNKANVFKVKYDLPEIDGSPKQQAWAQDVRTKFLERLETKETTFSPEIIAGVREHILTQTSAKWWIDKKEVSLDEQIAYVKTLCKIQQKQHQQLTQTTTEKPRKNESVIVIDCQNKDKITITCHKKDAEYILKQYEFTTDDNNTWERNCSIEDNERNGIVDGLCLTLLKGEFTTKVLPYKPPEKPHDGKIFIHNGRLCVETRTEAVYKAASRLGRRYIYLDLDNKNEILSFIQNYDVTITNDAKQVLEND